MSSSAIPRATWVKIYKQLQREANKFSQLNYRSFYARRIRDHFEANRAVTDQKQIQALFKKAQDSLESIRRQVLVGQLYPHQKTVVEEKLEQQKRHA